MGLEAAQNAVKEARPVEQREMEISVRQKDILPVAHFTPANTGEFHSACACGCGKGWRTVGVTTRCGIVGKQQRKCSNAATSFCKACISWWRSASLQQLIIKLGTKLTNCTQNSFCKG
jgi:hypothetical protein